MIVGIEKKKIIQLFAKKQYKVITVCAAAGTEHPIIPTSVVNAYHKKIQSQQKDVDSGLQQDEDSQMIETLSNIKPFNGSTNASNPY